MLFNYYYYYFIIFITYSFLASRFSLGKAEREREKEAVSNNNNNPNSTSLYLLYIYNVSIIINQMIEKLYSTNLQHSVENRCTSSPLGGTQWPLAIIQRALAYYDIRYALQARTRIRVHPVGRSNELITILYTFVHFNVRVCYYVYV